jgi:hypothetical protein
LGYVILYTGQLKWFKAISPFASRFSPDVTSSRTEKSLNDRLTLNSLVNSRLETEFRPSASFQTDVIQSDLSPISSTCVCVRACVWVGGQIGA